MDTVVLYINCMQFPHKNHLNDQIFNVLFIFFLQVSTVTIALLSRFFHSCFVFFIPFDSQFGIEASQTIDA